MRRIFILLYIGVLAVLFAAWYIYGLVLKNRSDAQFARVVIEAHGGGARVIAAELEQGEEANRKTILDRLRKRVQYPVEVVPTSTLPQQLQRKIKQGETVVAWVEDDEDHGVVTPLSSKQEVVRIGPFPDYTLGEIEASIRGWALLTAEKLNESTPEERPAILADLRSKFDIPIEISTHGELPSWPKQRLEEGNPLVLYPLGDEPDRSWYTATPLADATELRDETEIVRFGPFPRFEDVEQKAATATLALVLLPAALIITLLLRPVAKQLRRVEDAAIDIASGDLSARVNVKRSGSARQLAVAFNKMANQTEVMVRNQRDLLQAVSHELRTPLARIHFAIELIEAAKTDEERSKRLQSLVAASEEMDALVGELLDYVKLDGGNPDSPPEPIDPYSVFESMRLKYSEIYPQLDIQMPLQDSSQPLLVYADQHGFQRSISNLLSNACRFAKSTINVTIALDRGNAVIDVDDDGCGINEDDRAIVLEPFVQVGDEPDAKNSGVGLGLALVNRIVNQNGGKLEISDSPLGGCRIRTKWPAK